MSKRITLSVLSEATPAAASTVAGSSMLGLERFDHFVVDCDATAGPGGTLDVYIQRKLATDVWEDWIHFPQLGAGATARWVVCPTSTTNTISVVGGGTDAAPTPALAANTCVGGRPLDVVRLVYVAGVGAAGAGSCSLRVVARIEEWE